MKNDKFANTKFIGYKALSKILKKDDSGLNKSTNDPSMKLQLYNTLTKKKEEFKSENNQVRWYICGPTVYDSPHIGHARTYISFDAIRRILEGYFGYDVCYVMNITDVDDKIINKARECFISETKTKNPVMNTEQSHKKYKNLPQSFSHSDVYKNSLSNSKNHEEYQKYEFCTHDFSKKCKEITIKYEKEFFDSLDQLCVAPPTFVTRVSEYIHTIEDFIADLISKKMAYTSNGSVYFDIEAYKKKFDYPRFVDKSALCDEDYPLEGSTSTTNATETPEFLNKSTPTVENKKINALKDVLTSEKTHSDDMCANITAKENSESNNEKLMRSLSTLDITTNKKELQPKTEKKNFGDFALWKFRNTDLFYDSSFGTGRPGWHIECSAMAHSIFPKGLDIHSGGIDLTFPHHENEMAQSQAKINENWVQTWLHTGHLHINGLKMSKSLKNFITIGDFLKKFTARQIRIAFLSNKWWLPMTFSEELMQNAVASENRIFTFLSILESRIDHKYVNSCNFRSQDLEHLQYLENTKRSIHTNLCDNIDTSGVLKNISELVSYYYLHTKEIESFVLKAMFDFTKKILDCMGLFTKNEISPVNNSDNVLLDILNTYRNEIRDLCKKKADYKSFFAASDAVRNELKQHNIVLEDTKTVSSVRKIN